LKRKKKLYENNIGLKTFINNLKLENNGLRSEIHKLELEYSKKGENARRHHKRITKFCNTRRSE